VPFTPAQAEEIQQRFPNVQMTCEQSEIRCFNDAEYAARGVTIQSSMENCDILMGIKEVPIDKLISDKTYLFFSHTIKKQPYNRELLQAVVKKNIRLIDYEALRDRQGNRLVAFGRYAGIVGAYNGLWTYGKRFKIFTLRRAYECFDVNDLKLELRKIVLPPIKIILTGAGRVGRGAMETLDSAGIRKVNPQDFLQKSFSEPVYVQLSSGDYHRKIDGTAYSREEFHQHPERYESYFYEYVKVADMLLAGAFWNPKAPVLFTSEDTKRPDFKVRVIADITCDIDGSLPTTKKATTITDPLYDFNPATGRLEQGLSSDHHITVMAIDNLPCELPRSASEEFGRDLIDRVLPLLIGRDKEDIIKRATITEKGSLTYHFKYLQDYLAGK
jgi:saccharopine dehydrogenase (NAD+, L-lysine forming)